MAISIRSDRGDTTTGKNGEGKSSARRRSVVDDAWWSSTRRRSVDDIGLLWEEGGGVKILSEWILSEC